jgi:hypothetical protein
MVHDSVSEFDIDAWRAKQQAEVLKPSVSLADMTEIYLCNIMAKVVGHRNHCM